MSDRPRFGFTRSGLPVHARVIDHHPGGLNKRIAASLTARVGTMRAFWYFNVLSLLSLPATLVLVGLFSAPASGPLHFFLTFGWIYLITWVCQNYIQLVLLPALMVGQNLQNEASDARAAKQFEDTEKIVGALDLHTTGGLKDVLDAVNAGREDVAGFARTVRSILTADAGKGKTTSKGASGG